MSRTGESAASRLTFRVDPDMATMIDNIRDARGMANSSDAVREAVAFYHSAVERGAGAGSTPVVLQMPNAMLRRAEGLVGSADRDVPGVLTQALNLGLRALLEDAAEQDALARRARGQRDADGREARAAVDPASQR